MKDIKELENRGVRCDNKPHMEFVEKLTTEKVHELMNTVISWENHINPALKKIGIEGRKKYKQYLNKSIKDIPHEVLDKMYGNLYSHGDEIYHYISCCN